MDALEKSGHKSKVQIGTDVAASEFLTADGKYDLDFKNPDSPPEMKKTGDEMIVPCACFYFAMTNIFVAWQFSLPGIVQELVC